MVNNEILRNDGKLPCGHSAYTMISTIDHNWISCLNCKKQFARHQGKMVEIVLNVHRVHTEGRNFNEDKSEYDIRIKDGKNTALPAVDGDQEKMRIHMIEERKPKPAPAPAVVITNPATPINDAEKPKP